MGAAGLHRRDQRRVEGDDRRRFRGRGGGAGDDEEVEAQGKPDSFHAGTPTAPERR